MCFLYHFWCCWTGRETVQYFLDRTIAKADSVRCMRRRSRENRRIRRWIRKEGPLGASSTGDCSSPRFLSQPGPVLADLPRWECEGNIAVRPRCRKHQYINFIGFHKSSWHWPLVHCHFYCHRTSSLRGRRCCPLRFKYSSSTRRSAHGAETGRRIGGPGGQMGDLLHGGSCSEWVHTECIPLLPLMADPLMFGNNSS